MSSDSTFLQDSEVAQLLEQRPSGPCWAGKLYLGSMILLDFGTKILVTRPRGSVYVGSTSLSIRNVYWELIQRNKLIVSADTIDTRSFDATVLPLIHEQSISAIRLQARNGFVQLVFSNRVALDIDFTGRWSTEDALAELTLSDGRYIRFLLDGKVVLSEDRDLLRMHWYESASSHE